MKQKSHSGAKKRIKITATGKLLRRGAAMSHLLTNKGRSAKKKNRKNSNVVHKADVKNMRALLHG